MGLLGHVIGVLIGKVLFGTFISPVFNGHLGKVDI